jgi:hypothetical protein
VPAHDRKIKSPTLSASWMKIPTISEVHPSNRKHTATASAPPIMNGRRLPHRDRDRSARMPTTGCIMSPESGPAIHTKDIRDFVMPSWRRYGVQSACCVHISVRKTWDGWLRSHLLVRTRGFNAPGNPSDKTSQSLTLRKCASIEYDKPLETKENVRQSDDTECEQYHSRKF